MKRKQFLIGGLTLAAPALTGFGMPDAAAQPVPASQTQLRLDSAGRLERSNDGGCTWAPQHVFGPDVVVTELQEQGGLWNARLRFNDVEFSLQSENGRIWFSPGRRERRTKIVRTDSSRS